MLSETYLEQCRQALAAEQAHSLATTHDWAHVDKAKVHQDWDALYKEIAAHIDDAGDPADARSQAFVARHLDIARRFYSPSKEAYIGTSLFYAANPGMKAFHDGYHPQMVEFLGRAICVYAEVQL